MLCHLSLGPDSQEHADRSRVISFISDYNLKMFLLHRPSLNAIEAFLTSQRKARFSYPEIGATRGHIPTRYIIDCNRVRLGQGAEVFERATAQMKGWIMFALDWVELLPKSTQIEPGATVAVLIHHFGFWSLNASRVVYAFNEERRFGFAYGTLEDHAEQGEERFSIQWLDDDSVWYEIIAFSRPRQWQARIAWPIGRMLQKKFARDSKSAMVAAVRD
jgi:uncharacterized protein (UPF0548 family)